MNCARLFPWLPLAAAAAGAFFARGRCYVGFLQDDAAFVLLSRSLLEALAGRPAPDLAAQFSVFLPGYPAFLAPFTALLAPHWDRMLWTTAAVSVLSVYGLWRLLDGLLEEEARRWAVLLYSFHPLVMMNSGLLMSDPFLACLFIWGLAGLRLALAGGGAGAWALLAGCSLWAALTKPIGLLLPLAAAFALAAAGRRKALVLLAVSVWLPLAAAAAYAVSRNGTPTYYLYSLLRGLASIAHQGAWERVYGLLHFFAVTNVLAVPLPRGPLYDAAGAVLGAVFLIVLCKGLSALLAREDLPSRAAALAAGLLLFFQLLVMALWTARSERYALPMLPLALAFLVPGARAALGARWSRPLLAAAVLALGSYSARLASAVNSGNRPLETRLCAATLGWISANTPPDARLLGSGPLIGLYTGRAAENILSAPDADAFLATLSRRGITYAVVTDIPLLSPGGPYANNHALQKATEDAWVRSHPRYFRKVFSSPEERREIYAVSFPPRLGEAARLYSLAGAFAGSGRSAAAEEQLRLALSARPDFPAALAALAAVREARGAPDAEVEGLLRRAVVLEPNFPRASRHLVKFLRGRGRDRDARAAAEAARAALPLPSFEAPE